MFRLVMHIIFFIMSPCDHVLRFMRISLTYYVQCNIIIVPTLFHKFKAWQFLSLRSWLLSTYTFVDLMNPYVLRYMSPF